MYIGNLFRLHFLMVFGTEILVDKDNIKNKK
jgi:hypothetical protein